MWLTFDLHNQYFMVATYLTILIIYFNKLNMTCDIIYIKKVVIVKYGKRLFSSTIVFVFVICLKKY